MHMKCEGKQSDPKGALNCYIIISERYHIIASIRSFLPIFLFVFQPRHSHPDRMESYVSTVNCLKLNNSLVTAFSPLHLIIDELIAVSLVTPSV